jgi:hypothetical protein
VPSLCHLLMVASGTFEQRRNLTLKISDVFICREVVFQRLGPNVGGGAERGLAGCSFGDLLVVRLVAGTALALVVAAFGVCGS